MKTILSLPLRTYWLILFLLFYFTELVWSSILLAIDIMKPGGVFHHGIIAVDIDIKHPTGLILLSNLISMTPGSLNIELTPDRKKLYIHSMYLKDPEGFRKDFKKKYELKIKRIFE